MVEPLRHRQTKGAATDMFFLTPPRHISTLHKADLASLLVRSVHRGKADFGIRAPVQKGPTTDSGRLPEHRLALMAKRRGPGAQEQRAASRLPVRRTRGLRCFAPAIMDYAPPSLILDHPMPTAGLAPLDEAITIEDLTRDPYPIYRRLRREAPVLRVKSVGRTFLTKAADTKYVKDNAALFSSDDPNTPMKRAFLAHTLMRKDHDEHRTERMAMMPALMPKTIESAWAPLYAKLAAAYLDRLPRGEVVDLFPALAGPLAARMLAHAMGVQDASDEDMQRWSQTLIDGAGNFGWTPGPFQATDIANAEMDKCIRANAERVGAEPDSSALSFMVNAKNPILESQMIANVKIAIGGGINEPRDALLTILYGLLTNPDQLNAVRAGGKWRATFEEGVRWVAPIQASSRLVMEDTEIRGCFIPKGDTLMTIQASAHRDEEGFADGENYNVLREPNSHHAFGNGPHHCAGAHLSRRTVGVILLPMLFERFPNMTLPDPASVRWHGFGFRGPLNLPVLLQ